MQIKKTIITLPSMFMLIAISLYYGSLIPALSLLLLYPFLYLALRIYLWMSERGGNPRAKAQVGETSFGITMDGKETQA